MQKGAGVLTSKMQRKIHYQREKKAIFADNQITHLKNQQKGSEFGGTLVSERPRERVENNKEGRKKGQCVQSSLNV